MKKILLSFFIFHFSLFAPTTYAADEDFSFEEYNIVESDAPDVNAEPVSLNPGAVSAEVSGFDIAGIFLGMGFEDVYELVFDEKILYEPLKKNSIVYTINKDWKYNLDYECREQKIFVPAALENCINTLARNRGLMYASELHMIRPATGEEISVFFTSNATDNVVWRITYKNDVNTIEGDNEKFENQREKKILAFWKSVLEKYGAPNSGTDKWLTSDNAYDPMMTAYYGVLDMVDMGRMTGDTSKNINDARENFQAKPYSF